MPIRLLAAALTALHMHAIRWWREYVALLTVFAVVIGLLYCFFLSPPRAFPTGELLRVEAGAPLPDVAALLAERHIVRSATAFKLLVRAVNGARSIDAGTYRFDKPVSAMTVAVRLLKGEFGIPAVRITFPEGLSAREMSELVGTEFSLEFAGAFLREAVPHEGFLFPDTYHFSGADTPESVVAHMRETFDTRTALLLPTVTMSGHSLSDLVTMASILEKEANTDIDRRIVAGILWKRISIGMALQVDAVFGYIYGKSAYAPTFADLEIDSPYNTYTHRGLPPTPIGNPGLEALTAALEPTKTAFLYYLTGTDGKMHYARTFAEHQANRAKYLK